MPGPGGHGGIGGHRGGPGGPGGHRGPGGNGPGSRGGYGRGPMTPPPPSHYGGWGMGHRPYRRGFGCSGCLMPVLSVVALIIFVLTLIF